MIEAHSRYFPNARNQHPAFHSLLGAIAVAALLLTTACQSTPQEIPEDLSKQEFFQRAQENMDELNWDSAMVYLEEFKVRFPDDQANIAAADYQISLIHYKLDRFDQAEEGFSDIIARYESAEDPSVLPQWVEVLSRKLLNKIEEAREES